jgi:hypothetical protein
VWQKIGFHYARVYRDVEVNVLVSHHPWKVISRGPEGAEGYYFSGMAWYEYINLGASGNYFSGMAWYEYFNLLKIHLY